MTSWGTPVVCSTWRSAAPLDSVQDIADLLDLLVEDGQVRAEELDGELSLGPGQHLGQLVGDRLLEDVGDARELVELLAHRLR